MATDLYYRRKAEGKCTQCGAPVEKGVYCAECATKHNQRTKADRQYLKSIGICVNCYRREAEPNQIRCFECAEKMREHKKITYQNKSPEDKQKINEYNRRKYRDLKAKGICVKCRKRSAYNGNVYCGICSDKANSQKRSKQFGKRIGFENRETLGICRFCNEPVEQGYKVCRYHHNELIEKSKLSKRRRNNETN